MHLLMPRGLQPVRVPQSQRSFIQRLIDAIQLSLITSKLSLNERAQRSRLLTRQFPNRIRKQIILISPPCIFFDDGTVECSDAPPRPSVFPTKKVPGFK